MSAFDVAKSAASHISELTLQQGPSRLFTFLSAVNRSSAISMQLEAKVKFTKERQAEGWALLDELRKASVAAAPPPANPAIESMAACEEFQATGLVQIRTMLEMTNPEQALFLFHDFTPGKGMAAVFNAETFLLRRERLAHGPERRGSRKADAQALKIIDEIGITKESLKELQATVDQAQSPRASVLVDPSDADAQEARHEALRKIHAWVTTWAEMARTVITRRDHLIQLGIAKRRPKAAKATVVPPVVTPPATPAVPSDNGPESRAA